MANAVRVDFHKCVQSDELNVMWINNGHALQHASAEVLLFRLFTPSKREQKCAVTDEQTSILLNRANIK